MKLQHIFALATIISSGLFLKHGNVYSQQPNIIYIMADDLGYGDLGCYGQSKIKTPNIDRMAQEGMRFLDHYSGSTVCMPSRASLLTGMDMGHATVRGNPTWTKSGLPVNLSHNDVTVADELKRAGYKTAIIGKWGLAEGDNFKKHLPSEHGFDYFFGYRSHGDAHHYYWDTLFYNKEPFIVEGNNYKTKTGKYTHDLFVDSTLAYIHRNRQNPFFLYVAFTLPHYELTVPEDSKQPYQQLGWPEKKMNTKGGYKHDAEGNTAYAGMVSRMDRDMGRILNTLKHLGIDKNTLVIFTSDNGPEYDKGSFFESNGQLRGGKRELYEGGIRAPFIVWYPATIKAGTTTEHISAFWDFLPTACDLAGIKPSSKNINGISYLPTLIGQPSKQKKHDLLYWEFNEKQGPIQAIRKDNWKLVVKKGKSPELYNLSKDIGEKNNVAQSNPDILKELLHALENYRTPNEDFPMVKKNR
jgi:arylsulfatase A-like enzyme